MSTIYQDVASAVLPVLPYFTVDGIESWLVVRPDSLTRQPVSVGFFTGYVVRNAVDKSLLSLPQTPIYTAEWLLFASLDEAITPQAEDTFIGVTRTFVVSGDPQNDFAMWYIPLAVASSPDMTVAPLTGATQGLRIGLRVGVG